MPSSACEKKISVSTCSRSRSMPSLAWRPRLAPSNVNGRVTTPTVSAPISCLAISAIFFFNETPTPEIYTLSLHDALPIDPVVRHARLQQRPGRQPHHHLEVRADED